MSAALTARDAITSALDWECSAYGWRLMAVEGIHALAAAKRREDALRDQVDALRQELRAARGCAVLHRQPDDDALL